MTVPSVVDPNVGQVDPIRDPKAPVKFEYLNEIPAHESITILFYGGSGVGKTAFVGSARERTLIINIGNGLATLQGPWAMDKFFKKGFPIVATIREEINRETGMFLAADAFDKVKAGIEFAMDKFPDRFDTIAVDDASQLRAFAMNKGLELNDDFQRSKTLAKGKLEKGYILSIQDYGAEMGLVEQFVANTVAFCKDEKKHFILTAHERITWKKIKDNQGKVIGEEEDKIRAGFTGKTFPDDIPQYFDLVWRADVVRTGGKGVYRAYTEDAMKIKAKSRYPGVFKPLETWPDFQDIHARIKAAGVMKS